MWLHETYIKTQNAHEKLVSPPILCMQMTMISVEDIVVEFNQVRHDYAWGWACPAASGHFRRWLSTRGVSPPPSKTVFIATSHTPLRHKDGEPASEFKVCTKVFRVTQECIWAEEPMPEGTHVVVRWCANHEVVPCTLEDGSFVLVDFSIDQFPGDKSLLRIYMS